MRARRPVPSRPANRVGAGRRRRSRSSLDAAAAALAANIAPSIALAIASFVMPPRRDIGGNRCDARRTSWSVDGLLHCEGDVWAVHWGGRTARVRDSRGMRHLAVLLARPGTEVHSLELGGAPGAVTSGDAAPLLDDRARAAYKARLADLGEDLAEAEAFNDTERAARTQAEIDALVDQLTAAAGLGGRDRGTTTDAERARVAVRRALKAALDRLAEVLPDLGAHLDATLRTGVFCAYVPDPASPVRWSILDGPSAGSTPPAPAPPPPPAPRRPRPVVVGRDAERAALHDAWAAGGVALVSGEPGIGKTTLLADLAASVDASVGGRCDEHVGVPFQPLVEVVRSIVELDGADAVRRDAGAGATSSTARPAGPTWC